MDETMWPDLEGSELRFSDSSWELTGTVEVRNDGRRLAAEAVAADYNRHKTGTLIFTRGAKPPSLNPGDLGSHFDRIERTRRNQFLVVKKTGRNYRYRLARIERS